jgi:hypothetical protein
MLLLLPRNSLMAASNIEGGKRESRAWQMTRSVPSLTELAGRRPMPITCLPQAAMISDLFAVNNFVVKYCSNHCYNIITFQIPIPVPTVICLARNLVIIISESWVLLTSNCCHVEQYHDFYICSHWYLKLRHVKKVPPSMTLQRLDLLINSIARNEQPHHNSKQELMRTHSSQSKHVDVSENPWLVLW